MAEINLLQNKIKDTSFAWQNQTRYVLVFLWLVLITLLAVAGIFYLLKSNVDNQLETVNAQNQILQQSLNEKEKSLGDAISFQAQLANLKTLVDRHTYLSPLLNELTAKTFVLSQYQIFNLEDGGRVHLEGSVDTYQNLGKLLLGLTTSDQFSDVRLIGVSPSAGEKNNHQFSIELIVNPEIFKRK
jgi:uncharacterized protein (UPF0333 family)